MVLELVVGNIGNDLEQLSTDLNEFLQKQITTEEWNKFSAIFKRVNFQVDMVLAADHDKLHSVFQDTLKPFGQELDSFGILLLKAMNGDMSRIFESDRFAYISFMGVVKDHSKEIGLERANKVIAIIENWMDYFTIVSVNVSRNVSQLANALKKVDANELEVANYGTLLSLACIIRALYSNGNKEKLDVLISLGEKHSDALESYADTIDILCNPDEVEMLGQIDSKLQGN